MAFLFNGSNLKLGKFGHQAVGFLLFILLVFSMLLLLPVLAVFLLYSLFLPVDSRKKKKL